jgi:c-di-GMP-binding flagellar brake protein YcgR
MTSGPFERINDSTYLRSLVEKVVAQNSPTVLSDMDGKILAKSSLLDINSVEKSLYLAAPKNVSHEHVLKPQDNISVFISHNGLEMRFNSKIKEIEEEPFNTLVIEIPSSLKYRQRRETFRVFIEDSHVPSLSLKSKTGETVNGEVTNISIGGLAVICGIASNPSFHFDLEETLNCTITLPENKTINCQLIICFIHKNENNSICKLGVEFKSLNREQSHDLSMFINHTQRRQIKVK